MKREDKLKEAASKIFEIFKTDFSDGMILPELSQVISSVIYSYLSQKSEGEIFLFMANMNLQIALVVDGWGKKLKADES